MQSTLQELAEGLLDLMHGKREGRPSKDTNEGRKKAANRGGGVLDQTATLFVSVLKALNAPEGRMAGKFQLTLLDTLKHSSEADKLPQLHAPPTDDANLLANGEKLLGIAHGALKSEIIGSLGRGVSNKRMAELSGRSVSTVKKAKTSVNRGHTPMLMLKMRPGVKRQKVCGDETVLSPCTTQPTQDCQFRPVNHSRACRLRTFGGSMKLLAHPARVTPS